MTGAAAGKAGTEERTDPTDGRAGKRTGTGVIAENGNQRAIGDHPGKDSGPNAAKLSRRWGESKAGVQEKARRPGGRLQRLVRRCWRQSMMT